MTNHFKSRLKKLIGLLLLGFLLLFVFRLIYGYTVVPKDNVQEISFLDGISQRRKNYATKKYQVQKSKAVQSAVSVDQKYEKIAEVSTKSAEIVKAEKRAREKVKQYNALIQFEQKSGNFGNRRLHLLIGVPPENFDSLYHNLIRIGQVQTKSITKKDKTNEYKELNAKKRSLEKILNSLTELKAKGGKIEEYIQLENRILDIEQQLQELGVSLGNFDDENEFCTVRFSLSEGKEVQISFLHRVKVALEWTTKYYLKIILTLFFLSWLAYLVVVTIEKLKILERIFNRKE